MHNHNAPIVEGESHNSPHTLAISNDSHNRNNPLDTNADSVDEVAIFDNTDSVGEVAMLDRIDPKKTEDRVSHAPMHNDKHKIPLDEKDDTIGEGTERVDNNPPDQNVDSAVGEGAERVGNPLEKDVDIISEVAGWLEGHQHLFFALVSTTWRDAWRRPRVTRAVTASTTTELLNYCFEIGLKRSEKVCSATAYVGKVDLLEFCLANGCKWNSGTCGKAAEAGHLELLRWARKHGCPWDSGTCLGAASRGHLSILTWARNRGCPCVDGMLCLLAARGGHMNVLRWVEKNLPFYLRASNAVCDGAAEGGHLGCLKWARSKASEATTPATAAASATASATAAAGNLELLQWVMETQQGRLVSLPSTSILSIPSYLSAQQTQAKGSRWEATTSAKAAAAGHLELLQWAKENGCPCDRTTSAAAARGGHLDVLQWLRANECPWDKSTCSEAAKAGQLEVLKWARGNGCPWSEITCVWAEKRGHSEVVEWALANGCPWDGPPRDQPVEVDRLVQAPPGTPSHARRIAEGSSHRPASGVGSAAGTE